MYQQLIIQVDDFFANPHELRKRAFALSYTTPPSRLNPNARGPIAEKTQCDLATRETTLRQLRNHIPGELKFAMTEFRYIHQRTIKRQYCHADGQDIAGIVYLTLPEHCQGGTVFFRHKPTGDYWAHPVRRALYNFDDATEWEETYRVPMEFNRLVCYPGRLFHAVGTPYFGDTIQNARLTLNLFLDLIDKMVLDRQFDELAARLASSAAI